MAFPDQVLHPVVCGVLIAASCTCSAEQQLWGRVAEGNLAVYWARGGVGVEDDDLLVGPVVQRASAYEGDEVPGVQELVPEMSVAQKAVESRAATNADILEKAEVYAQNQPILSAVASEEVREPTNPSRAAKVDIGLASKPEEGNQKPVYAQIESDAPPVASQMAKGGIIERDEPVLSGNIPLKLGLGLGAVLLSSSLDKSGDRFGRDHGDHGFAKKLSNVGNALPLVALGGASLAVLTAEDPRLARTGLAAVEAGGGAVLGSLGLKYVIGRSRPEAGMGSSDFHPFSANNGNSSMPSIHTAAMWGAVTPFAKEYDMPWLYGVAALTNYARVAQRKHWVSDTVAGSLLGYLAGDIAWRWNRSAAGIGSQVYVTPNGVGMSWPLR